MNEENKEIKKSSNVGWGILGFFFPLIGLILFLVWLKSKKGASKAAGIGTLIGLIVSIILGFLFVYGPLNLLFKFGRGDDIVEKYDPNAISNIEFKKEFSVNTKLNSDNPLTGSGEVEVNFVTISLNNGRLSIKESYGSKKLLKEYYNVKEVYYKDGEYPYIIVVTNSNEYYIKVLNELGDDGYAKIILDTVELNGKYKYFSNLKVFDKDNKIIYIPVGNIVDGEDILVDRYDLNTGEVLPLPSSNVKYNEGDYSYYVNTNAYILPTREYKFNNQTGKLKLYAFDKYDSLKLFIDDNYYAYTYSYGYYTETELVVEKINNSKVKKMYDNKESNTIKLEFEDGKTYSLNYNNIEY